jgi:hypothetical protein
MKPSWLLSAALKVLRLDWVMALGAFGVAGCAGVVPRGAGAVPGAGVLFGGIEGSVLGEMDGAVPLGADGAVLAGAEGAVLEGAEGAVLGGADGAVLDGADGAVLGGAEGLGAGAGPEDWAEAACAQQPAMRQESSSGFMAIVLGRRRDSGALPATAATQSGQRARSQARCRGVACR